MSRFLFFFVIVSLSAQVARAQNTTRPLTIWVCGDVMTGRGVAPYLKTKRTSLSVWRDKIQRADFAFCNLEGAFGNNKSRIQQREKPQLLLDQQTPQLLADAGFDVVSQANNHALDGGENGLRQLQNALHQQHIATVGAQFDDNWKPLRLNVRGQKITILAASAWGKLRSQKARVRSLQNSKLLEQVRALSRRGERVLVSLHWGIEYSKTPTRGQIQVAHNLIDAGALAVIGHHPHVAQTVETYRGRPIFYSLGNFLFDRTPRTQSGIAAILQIDGTQISWRTFAIEPQAGKVQLSKTNDAPPLPRREKLIQQTRGHFLPDKKTTQTLVWSKRANKQDVLRVWQRGESGWAIVAQAFPRPVLALRVGDVDGDGTDDLAVELWQRSKLDVQEKRRLHVYSVRDGRLKHSSGFVPRWRGSALSRPFRNWCFVGRNQARGFDLAAIEYSNDPSDAGFEWLSVYRWNGFGFRVLWQTPVRGSLRQLQSGRDAHGVWLRVVQTTNRLSRVLVLRPIIKAKIVSFRAAEVRCKMIQKVSFWKEDTEALPTRKRHG